VDWKKTAIIGVMLLAGYLVVQMFSEVEMLQNEKLNPQTVPETFGGWQGKDVPVGEIEKKFLPEDTLFVKRFFQKPSLGIVYLVVVFTGKDRRSIHRPEVCYPSQGWSINDTRTELLPVDHPIKNLNVTRLDIAFGKKDFSQQEIVFYWFMGNDRVTHLHWKRVFLMGFDRCVYGKNHQWSFFRVSTAVGTGGVKSAENVIRSFVSDLFPQIAGKEFKQF
jgi:EpsI family protein